MTSARPSRDASTPLIALVGNPNAGKTSLFNSLTGAHQKVGNYPGVTVEKVSGKLILEGIRVEVVDVPGLYSVRAESVDETVAAEVIEGRGHAKRQPDLLICVIDASNLERNLFFFSQLAESRRPIVVALTMTDLVRVPIDWGVLSTRLGVPVVPVIAHKGIGLDALKKAMSEQLQRPSAPQLDFHQLTEVEAQIDELFERLARNGIDVTRQEVRTALRDPENGLIQALRDMPELLVAFEEARDRLKKAGVEKACVDVKTRYDWASRVKAELFGDKGIGKKSRTDRIDAILTNRFFGMIVFIAIMYLLFQSIYTLSQPLMNGIGWVFDKIGDVVGNWLSGAPVLQSLVVNGVIAGVGAVTTFLPQIMILFFFIAVLEGTGYLARAAFLMDKLLGWCGLNGRAFIPLLSSFACAIPGIMAARVMPDPRSRLATILVSPLMSCSARLPVYILLIGIFVEPQYGPLWAGFALFAMHFVGLLVAIPVVFVLNRSVIKGPRLPFLLELPPYQIPKWKDVWFTMISRGKVFLHTAGTIIVVLSVVIWALLYFPRNEQSEISYRAEYVLGPQQLKDRVTEDNYVLERSVQESYLGRFGRAIEPVMEPAGFDWRISTAILAAFPAREVVVSSLGIIFSLGGDVDEESGGLRRAVKDATWPDGRPLLTPWTAVGLMVFFALCCQCMATLATVKRETNSWKWPLFMFVYMTALAYIAAVGINQLGKWIG